MHMMYMFVQHQFIYWSVNYNIIPDYLLFTYINVTKNSSSVIGCQISCGESKISTAGIHLAAHSFLKTQIPGLVATIVWLCGCLI